MADEVVLLDFLSSPFGMRLRISLALKGVKYVSKEQDLWDKSALLLQSNPVHKKVPVLIHNEKAICESAIALEYVDEVWTNNPLLPSDPYLRSQARFWVDFVDKKTYIIGMKTWRLKGEEQKAAQKEFIDTLKLLEEELADKCFFGGETLGIVDVALVPIYALFSVFEKFGNFSIEPECPKFIAWVKRCLENESMAKSLPDKEKVYDTVVEIRKSRGIE